MSTAKRYDEKRPIATQIRAMMKGQCIAFPIEKAVYIKCNMPNLKLITKNDYSTHLNREEGTIEVTRTH